MNAKTEPLATFDVPADGVTAPIEIDLQVHKVKVNLKVNEGSIPCDSCKVYFYSTSGKYVAMFDKATAERSVVLPRGSYVSYVSGSAEPMSAAGTVSTASTFNVLGGAHDIAQDQNVSINLKLVKASGKVLINGAELVPKIGGSHGYVNAFPTQKSDGLLVSASTQIRGDGTYVVWLPANVAHSWRVKVARDATSEFSQPAETAKLESELSGFDFRIQTKKIELKVKGLPGWDIYSVLLHNTVGVNEVGKSGTVELATGKYAVSVGATEMSDSNINTGNFRGIELLNVSDSASSFDVAVNAIRISGKFAFGTESIKTTSWNSYGTSFFDQSIGPKNSVRSGIVNGDLFNLWLPTAQYSVYSDPKGSYLGCYLVNR